MDISMAAKGDDLERRVSKTTYKKLKVQGTEEE
jgi:hypothetical protein